jgi:DNA invertase Pin-like site-specific DNA recombinase
MSTEQKVRRLRAEGYSYRTIADKIGISVGAVQRQLQKPSSVFKLRERDPDFLKVEKALELGATLHEA